MMVRSLARAVRVHDVLAHVETGLLQLWKRSERRFRLVAPQR